MTMRASQLLLCIVLLALPLGHAFAADPMLDKRVLKVELNKGQMLKLDSAASSVMVADPAIADIQVVSPKLVYIHAKKIGETSIYAIDSSDRTIVDVTIEVTHNISKLARAIKEMVPTADINITTVDGGIVLNGFADSPMEAEQVKSLAGSFLGEKDKLVNLITTAGSDQVTLMVRIAEVSRNELKRFGINLAAVITRGNFLFQALQGRAFLSAADALLRNSTDAGTDNTFHLRHNAGGTQLDGVIDALENQGLISVLAEPNLTTTSGKAANFLAGGEFPIPIVDSEGKVSVQYKPYGISLNFTPVVLSKDKISLTVAPEVSSISNIDSLTVGSSTQFAIPSIQTRRAETTVELGSGQTFAIAGLLKNDRTNNIQKFPGLGDMPVLGTLFRSQQFQNDQSELVILVTPYAVRPVAERETLQTPLDGYVPPNDLQRVLLGKLYEEQAPAPQNTEIVNTPMPADVPKLHGAGGFIME